MVRDFDLNELPPNEDNLNLDGAPSNINPHGDIGVSPIKEECDNEAVSLVSGATSLNLPIKEQESPQFHGNNIAIAFNSEATTSSAAIPHEDTPSHEGQDEASSKNKEHDEGGIVSLATDTDVPIEEDELPQLVNDTSSSTSPHERLDGHTTINKEDDKSDAEERNTTTPIQEQNVAQILINENVVSTSSSNNVPKPWNNTLSCEVTTTEDEDRESSKGGISLNASGTHPIDPVEEHESPQVAINDKAIEIKVARSSESSLSCEKMSSDGDKEKSRGDSEERNTTMPIQEQNVPQILINENVVSTSSSINVSKPCNNTLSCEVTTTEDEDRESSKGGISLNASATHPIDPVEEHESPQVMNNVKAIEIKVARSSESPRSCEKKSSEDGNKEKSGGDSEDANMDTNKKIEDRSLKRRRVEASSTGTHSNVYGSQPAGLQGMQRASRNQLSGFIFLSTMSTIEDCRKYSVFGLKDYRIQAVEKIKPGTYLFLFDCHSKFLHGIYTATTNGGMNLEPNAFGGRFPAQVKFTTHTLCPALPESVFKGFITHHGNSKFRQELSKDQVDSLISLFTSTKLAAPLSSNLEPPRGIENRSVPESEFANDYYYKKSALEASLHERALASSAFTMPSHLGANFPFSSHSAANLVRPALQASSHAHPIGPPAFPVPSHVGANLQFLPNRAGELVKLASESPNLVGFGPHSMLSMGHAGLGGNNACVSNLGAPPAPRNPWHLQNEKRF